MHGQAEYSGPRVNALENTVPRFRRCSKLLPYAYVPPMLQYLPPIFVYLIITTGSDCPLRPTIRKQCEQPGHSSSAEVMHRICRPISRSLCRYALIASYSANMSASPKTIAVAMSGGIDSAVSALLLQDQGHKVVGVFMKNWDSSDECGSETCDIDSDQKDMKEACDRLGIPAYEVDTSPV